MTRIAAIGFESGSLGVLTVTGGMTVSTVQKRTGAYSMVPAGAATTSYGTIVFSADKTEVYVRFGMYPTNVNPGTINGEFLKFADNAGAYQISCSVDAALMHWFLGSYAGTELGNHAMIPLNAWSCIEIWLLVANAPNGRLTIKVDGATVLTFSGDTQATAITSVRSFGLGKYRFAAGINNFVDAYYDDIAINDTAGAVNNSWIGRGGIYGIVPEGAGTYTDLIASAGNAWDCIEEVPPSDADYVYESTVDKKSTYALTALVPTTGTIDCINVIMRAKLDAAGAGNIARLIRSNGTDSQGADVGLDVSAKTIQDIIELDPGAGPGAWTVAAVNALQAGATVR